MLDKLFEAQKQAEAIKKRLDNVTVEGEAEGGKVKVTATGNREVTNIAIDSAFFSGVDREELEELVMVAVNNAMRQAENVSQAEMQAATKDMLGGLGGMFGQ